MSVKSLSNAFAAATIVFGLGVGLTVGGWRDVISDVTGSTHNASQGRLPTAERYHALLNGTAAPRPSR